MSEKGLDPHTLGTKAPEGGHTSNEGGKYDHWMDKELRGMTKMDRTEHSADERAHSSGKAGMQGGENPHFEILERERGDSTAKARPTSRVFEADEFDVNQFDKGDERKPHGRSEGEY